MAKTKTRKSLPAFEIPIYLQEVTVEDAIRCGFKQEWISAEGQGEEITLTSGAGCGSPWLQLMVKKDNESRYFRYDMRDFISAAMESITSEQPTT